MIRIRTLVHNGRAKLAPLSPMFAAGALCLLAFVPTYPSMSGLSWPPDEDLYRDMGAAQSFLDGRWWGDPAYAGELRWYPPFTALLVALIHQLTGLPLHVLFTRVGVFANVLCRASGGHVRE